LRNFWKVENFISTWRISVYLNWAKFNPNGGIFFTLGIFSPPSTSFEKTFWKTLKNFLNVVFTFFTMHPVTFHLRNKLTWMSRQLRRINKAADVMDWASAMHSIYNLLVDVSGNAELLQDSSPARNHLTKVTKS